MGVYLYPSGTETELKNAYIGEYLRTFTISRTEKSDMSSGWTYSDDAAGLTAGSGDFDDFFGYSAVLLNTSGIETAEIKQSGGVFSSAITNLGNITSGDNVMIKFPVRGIKMNKSGSTVTLSITEELNKEGYQYYAFNRNGTPQNKMYLGVYEGCFSNSVLKSWSGKSVGANVTLSTMRDRAFANGSNYGLQTIWQRWLLCAYYIMKYGNTNSQSTVGYGNVGSSANYLATGQTNNQTSATYGTTSQTSAIKMFGIENPRGNYNDFFDGAYQLSSGLVLLNTSNSPTSIAATPTQAGGDWISSGVTMTRSEGNVYNIHSIAGTQNGMFLPISIPSSDTSFTTYYTDGGCYYRNRFIGGGKTGNTSGAGIFNISSYHADTDSSPSRDGRLSYI